MSTDFKYENPALRQHFVYRVFDNRGLLLYVGCTKDPEKRYQQHRNDKPTWLQYLDSFRLEGPFEKVAGFARENTVIESEHPFFNALSEQRSIATKRSALNKRLVEVLRINNPQLFQRAATALGLSEEFVTAMERIDREVDEAIPPLDAKWRHRNYLQARIQRRTAA